MPILPQIDPHSAKTGIRTIMITIDTVDITIRNNHLWKLTGIGHTSNDQYIFEDIFRNNEQSPYPECISLDVGLRRLCKMTGCETLRGMVGRPLRIWIPLHDTIRQHTAYAYGSPWGVSTDKRVFSKQENTHDGSVSLPSQSFMCSRTLLT